MTERAIIQRKQRLSHSALPAVREAGTSGKKRGTSGKPSVVETSGWEWGTWGQLPAGKGKTTWGDRKQGDDEEEGPSRRAVRWAQGKSRLYESLMGRPGVWAHGAHRKSTHCGGKKGRPSHFQKMSSALSTQDKLTEHSHFENWTFRLCLSG